MMKGASLAIVMLSMATAVTAQTAATPPDLSLPPVAVSRTPAPAQAPAAQASLAASSVPNLDTLQPKAASAPTAQPAVSAPAVVPAPAPMPAAVPAAPKRKTVAKRAAAVKEPFADLPVNQPAKQAIQLSNGWAENNKAIVTRGAEGRVTFVFGEAMPTVVCAPLRMCDISLQAGEKVMGQPLLGDPTRWTMAPAFEGNGADRTVHVIVKPREAGLDTNLIIPTDRRIYRLRLVADEANYVSVVSFDYPDDDKKAWDVAMASQQTKEDRVAATLPSLSATDLDFDYSVEVESGRPKWKPLRAFNDGSHTYIQLPPEAAVTETPALIVIDPNGKEQLVNFRLRGSYFVVDQVIDHAQLVAGVGREALRVSVKHGCRKRGVFGCKD